MSTQQQQELEKFCEQCGCCGSEDEDDDECENCGVAFIEKEVLKYFSQFVKGNIGYYEKSKRIRTLSNEAISGDCYNPVEDDEEEVVISDWHEAQGR
tara:strand:- start:202 stop:492 length:291 start_codon:yes stop_codon:yes gene_type:complete